MVRDQLIELIQKFITASGSLPTSIGIPEIERVISDAERYFYQNYVYAVETKHYVIPLSSFESVNFKVTDNRQIKLPDCVVSVSEVKEIKGNNTIGILDRDITENRIIASELYLSPFSSDDLVYRTIQYSYYDLVKAYSLNYIQFDFNYNTHNITILGRDPRYDVCLKVMTKIPQQNLYDDPLFIDYVKGQSLLSMAHVYSMFTFQMPGGVTLNVGNMESRGQKMIDDVLQRMDGDNTADYFIMIN